MASQGENDNMDQPDQQHLEMEEKLIQFVCESLADDQEESSQLFSKQPWEKDDSKEKKKLYKKYKEKKAFLFSPDASKNMLQMEHFLNPKLAKRELKVMQEEYRQLFALKKAPPLCTDCVDPNEPQDCKPWGFWMNKFEKMQKTKGALDYSSSSVEEENSENENTNQTHGNEVDHVDEILMGSGTDALHADEASSSDVKCLIKFEAINRLKSILNSDEGSQTSSHTQDSKSSRVLSMEEF